MTSSLEGFRSDTHRVRSSEKSKKDVLLVLRLAKECGIVKRLLCISHRRRLDGRPLINKHNRNERCCLPSSSILGG